MTSRYDERDDPPPPVVVPEGVGPSLVDVVAGGECSA